MILDLQARLSRLSPESANSDLESYSTIKNSLPINIQPANGELTVIADGKLGQVYRAFTTVSGIEVGDLITVSGIGLNYIVNGVNNWFMQPLPHLELILFKANG